jgi:hypothetical protein
VNAASVQLFGAALDASDFARVMDKPEVVPWPEVLFEEISPKPV